MPMMFPTFRSLEDAARLHGFRPPEVGETEADFRKALAEHVRPIDMIESVEIASTAGWEKWDEAAFQKAVMASF